MSPEQARGEEVDARTDVWSIGMTWYHLLTGQLPWLSNDYPSAMLNIVQAEIPDVCKASRVPLPESLGKVMRRALQRDPSKRYPNAGAMLSDVRPLLDSEIMALTCADRRRMTADEAKRSDERFDHACSHLLGNVANPRGLRIWLGHSSWLRAPERVIVAVQRAIQAFTVWNAPTAKLPEVVLFRPPADLIPDLEAAGLTRRYRPVEVNYGPAWEWRGSNPSTA
jgi:serine/threonine protein kinase